MKVNTTTLILSVSLAVVAGLFGSTIFGVVDLNNSAQTSASATGLISGHVTTTLTDADGNIKAYRQTDNQIVNGGESCATKVLFGARPNYTGTAAAGSYGCTGFFNEGFKYIAIGNNTGAVNGTNSQLTKEFRPAATYAEPLRRGLATTVTLTNSTGTDGATVSFGKAVLSKTFTCASPFCATAQTVTESGLFNSTGVNNSTMFARQTFTAVTVNQGDSLTIQWTINIGGTTNALTP